MKLKLLITTLFLALVSLAQAWTSTQWNSGVTLQPLTNGQFKFVVPQPSGHVNAIKRNQTGLKPWQTITLVFQIKTQIGTPKFKSLDTSQGLKPNFRVMIAKGELENRWWPAGTQCAFLQDSLDKGKLTYAVVLNPSQWSDVNGKIDPARFKKDLAGAQIMEIVFGGGRSFSHGDNNVNGKAVYQLWSLKIQ